MRHIIPFFILLLSSCSIKEYIVDARRNEIVGGHGEKGTLLIDRKNRINLNPEVEKTWNKAGIYFYFDEKSCKLKAFEIRDTTRRFATSRGVAVGDSLTKVERIYGKPHSRILDLGNDGSVFWVWHGLFYKDLMFFTDSAGLTVRSILIGKYP